MSLLRSWAPAGQWATPLNELPCGNDRYTARAYASGHAAPPPPPPPPPRRQPRPPADRQAGVPQQPAPGRQRLQHAAPPPAEGGPQQGPPLQQQRSQGQRQGSPVQQQQQRQRQGEPQQQRQGTRQGRPGSPYLVIVEGMNDLRAVRRAVPNADVYVLGTSTLAGDSRVLQASGGSLAGIVGGFAVWFCGKHGQPWLRRCCGSSPGRMLRDASAQHRHRPWPSTNAAKCRWPQSSPLHCCLCRSWRQQRGGTQEACWC